MDRGRRRADDTGRRFWAFVTTGPLTLLTIANLVAAWQATGAARTWWFTAGLVAAVERAFTFSYFIPTMVGLMKATNSSATSRAEPWRRLNYLRHAPTLVAWLAA